MESKYRSLGVEIVIGKKSLVNIIDYGNEHNDFCVDLFDSDDKQVGRLMINQKAVELMKSGAKLKTKSVSQFKKEIK